MRDLQAIYKSFLTRNNTSVTSSKNNNNNKKRKNFQNLFRKLFYPQSFSPMIIVKRRSPPAQN